MAHLEYVDREGADPEVRDLLDADAETYGQPSLFARAMAHNPAMLAARQRYAGAVAGDGGLEPALVELATVAVSAANDCDYCVASHVEHLVEQTDVPADRVRAVARGDHDGLDPRERAVARLAGQIARDPAGVGADGIDALRAAGFDEAAVVAAVTACATAVSANAIADALGIEPADRGTPFATPDEDA